MKKLLTNPAPFHFTAIYVGGAVLWVLLFNILLRSMHMSPDLLSLAELGEDLGFVAITASLMYVILKQQRSHRLAIEAIRDHTREALVETVNRYDGLETISPVGIFYADHAGQRVAFNKRWWEITGLTATQSMGDGWTLTVHPDDRERVVDEWQNAVRSNTAFDSEYRIRRPDGGVVWVVSQAVPLLDASGTGEYMGVLTNITPQKQAEEALKQAATDYQLLFDRNPLPVWIYDIETLKFLAVNDTAVDLYGYSRDEFLSMTIKAIRPPDELPGLVTALDKECSGKFVSAPGTHVLKNGSRIKVQVTAIHLPYRGRPACIIAVNDVTEQLLAAETLRYQAGLLDVTPDAVVSTDMSMNILSWNKAAEQIYGWNADEIVGKPISEVVSTINVDTRTNYMEELRRSGSWKGDIWHKRRDGSNFVVSSSVATVHGNNGEVTGYVAINRDVTPYRQADEKLRQRNRELEALLSVSSALSGRFDLDIMLDSITHATRDLLPGVDRASLWLYDAPQDQIVLRAASGFGGDIQLSLGVNGEGGVIASVFRTRQAINIADTKQSSEFNPIGIPVLDTVKSVIGVPLIAEGQVIGCLFCDSITQTYAFGEDESRLLLTLAGHAAIAIQDARLHQRMQSELLERLRAEEAVHDSEELHRLAFKATPKVAIWDWHITSGAVRWSDGIETVYGYSQDLASSEIDYWRSHIHPDDRRRVMASLFDTVRGSEQNWSTEYRFERANSTYAFVSDKGFVVRDASGSAIRMIGSMVDITDQKIAEHALRESEERFRRIAESAPDMIFRWTLRSGFEFVSPAARDISGYTPEEYYEMPDLLHRIVLQEDRDMLDQVFDAGQEGTSTRSVPMRWADKSGQIVHIELRYMLLRDDDGVMLGVEGIAHDVSQHILAHSRLRELGQRLASTQDRERKRVALELHDDIGQTLTVTKMRLKMAINAIPQDNIELRGRLASVTTLVDDSLKTVRALSHELHPPLLAEMGWQAALEALCESLRSRGGLEITFVGKGQLLRLPADTEIAIYRLCQEAITNAVRHGESQNIQVVSRVSRSLITIQIEDDGRGFDLEQVRSASQPGIGLGLLSMQERADAIDARLTIKSSQGHGTRVLLRLPRVAKGAAE